MDIKYLDEERIKLWDKISYLEKILQEKSADLEIEVRLHAENARKHLNEIETSLLSINTKSSEVDGLLLNIKTLAKSANDIVETIKSDHKVIAELKTAAESSGKEIATWHTTVQSQFNEIQTVYSNNAAMVARLSEFETQCSNATDLSAKIEAIHKSFVSRKSQIDKTYYEVFGSVEKNETTGEEIRVKGLKDELDETYRQLTLNFTEHESSVVNSFNELNKRMSNFEESKTNDLNVLQLKWKDDFDKVKARIETLLPNALTTGLSYAYSEKKSQEEDESKSHATTFGWSIFAMVLVSLIPFIVSIHAIYTNVSLNEIILRLPRLVLAILPLYIPVLWIAYSSNRKGNLSKRLIEEYSHKEVLSKTYEGLSTQITSLGENDTANELRVKLLYNILDVSSENPGKLITDYNKSDHPVMDALDKSMKLTDSLEKLAKIPGFTNLAKKLSDKAEKIHEKQMAKAEIGLDVAE